MGHTTDFLGHVDIAPALNQDEIEYLTAFSQSRRFDRVDGPYAVPGNPMAVRDEERESVDPERYSRPGPGQPQLYCQWVPCWDGCCLTFDGHEKFYEPVRWMRYLVDHFLKPGALASRTGLPAFEHFTFDHRLDGMVVGCRRDTRELFAVDVEGNRVRERVLRKGVAETWREPLPYEVALDREQAESRRRRRVPEEPAPCVDAEVVDLGERRRAR